MAVIYGLEHFNYYTYGSIVTVQTDHKPILGLSKKPCDTISPRLQRMLLRLDKYNIQLEYVPGKNLVIADALSRAQSTTDKLDEVLGQEATVRINLLTQASPTKWEEITKMTTDDPEMQDVLHIKGQMTSNCSIHIFIIFSSEEYYPGNKRRRYSQNTSLEIVLLILESA
ncbi:retrovirus-related Pol polyprotein from transposon 17.6 [Trichonephila clavata]|uniref:Retrovirus-related Pol polyprotein from transposon 17.6 n=1 Tax=Trichonephila clavata TaxID=2740835 RepID=A0A8X6M001_TRICU|nr:retrovirus-related Pol polyprotein from transposon 17.6 [Trichonephila clavata]